MPRGVLQAKGNLYSLETWINIKKNVREGINESKINLLFLLGDLKANCFFKNNNSDSVLGYYSILISEMNDGSVTRDGDWN